MARRVKPQGVAVDREGNVFVADTDDGRIRRVDHDGGISTFSTQADHVEGLAFAVDGTLHAAGARISPDGTITTVAGGGTGGLGDGGLATEAALGDPRGVARDGSGNPYIADAESAGSARSTRPASSPRSPVEERTWAKEVLPPPHRSVDPSQYGGDGGRAVDAQLGSPVAVVGDGIGNVYVGDSRRAVVRRIDANGTISTVAGDGTAGYAGDGGPARSARFADVGFLAAAPSGALFIGDAGNGRLRRMDPDGSVRTVAGGGTQPAASGGLPTSAMLGEPADVVVDRAGAPVFTDRTTGRVWTIDSTGRLQPLMARMVGGDGAVGGSAQVEGRPVGTDAVGNVYLYVAGRFSRLAPHGVLTPLGGRRSSDPVPPPPTSPASAPPTSPARAWP